MIVRFGEKADCGIHVLVGAYSQQWLRGSLFGEKAISRSRALVTADKNRGGSPGESRVAPLGIFFCRPLLQELCCKILGLNSDVCTVCGTRYLVQ